MQRQITPLPHQAECQAKTEKARQQGQNRALIVMASGLGKTLTSAFDVKSFLSSNPEAKILFLAHQNEILEQARLSFQQVFGASLSYGMFSGQIKILKADAIFATFQSMRKELFGKHNGRQRCHFGPRHFDYVIVDESHHGKAYTYKEVIDYFKPKFLLGMTATPNRMDGKDIRDIFGYELFSLDLEEAMVAGLLTPVEYHLIADEIVDKGEIDIPPHLVSIQLLNRVFFAKKRDTEIVKSVLQRVAEIPDPRTIIFCPSIRHAESFAKLIPGAVPIHSGLTRKEHRQRMNAIRSGIARAAVTVDEFNEGIDIPEANVIVFLRSTQSKTIFYQQLGRGLRKVAGKDKVVVLDFVANCDRLQLIDELYESVVSKAGKGAGPRRFLEINWGEVIFEQRARDVLEVLHKIKVGLTAEVLIDYLKKLSDQLGRTPTSTDMDNAKNFPSASAFINRFGTWNNALKAAGMEPLKLKEYLSDSELAEKLKELGEQLGKVPTERDMSDAEGFPDPSAYIKRFGSWNKALKFAGMKTNREIGLSNEKLLKKLKKLGQRLGRTPSMSDMNRAKGFPHSNTYIARFGTWNNAVRAAGMEPNQE